MTGTFGGFEIGRRALHAQQKGVQVTGQNIANANTPGYRRQRVVMESLATPPVAGIAPMGYGVKVTDVRRITSDFYDAQIQQANSHYAYWDSLRENLEGVEVSFMEPGEHAVNHYLGEFFDAWQELSVSPESPAVRASLVEHSITLTRAVHDTYNRLADLSRDIETGLEFRVNEANRLAEEITVLNEKISFMHSMGKAPNELLDQRDQRLEELASLIDIRVNLKSNNTVEVVAGSRILLHDDRTFPIGLQFGQDTGKAGLFTPEGSPLLPQGGVLAGLVESYNNIIPRYQGALNEVVGALVIEVNKLHEEGYDLYGENTGLLFFNDIEDGNVPASLQFSLNETIIQDSNRIAAALVGVDEEEGFFPGDGSNAMEIARLREMRVMNEETATFSDYYRGVVARLGIEGREAERLVVAQWSVLRQLEQQRESISGVSLDEEMLDLVQFHHSYTAAAKYLSTLDQMLINLLAEVGR